MTDRLTLVGLVVVRDEVGVALPTGTGLLLSVSFTSLSL